MTKAVWTKFITDNEGAVVEGASVTVFLSDGITPASIFSDPSGAAKANPFLTPSGGKAEFYADPGIYVIQASKDGKTATWNNEEIGHARRDLDLSDLKSAANARNNLGLKSAALADIVGAASESGGVPTGAVIERGSNANGEYTKFADGTLICTQKRSIDLSDITTDPFLNKWVAAGNTLPAAFASTPAGFISMTQAPYSAAANRICALVQVNCTNEQTLSYIVDTATLQNAALVREFIITTIGRWY